jgi:hypothetical protein
VNDEIEVESCIVEVKTTGRSPKAPVRLYLCGVCDVLQDAVRVDVRSKLKHLSTPW